jgi:hypothetical protein
VAHELQDLWVDTYDGKANPEQWLTLSEIAIHTASRSDDMMANYLLVMLNQSANNWLLSLRLDSIGSWEDLKRAFVANYMAVCEHPGTKYDLEMLHQTSREPLCSFIRHFSETRNFIPNISDSEAIVAFTNGLLYHEQLYGKLYCKRTTTIGELL